MATFDPQIPPLDPNIPIQSRFVEAPSPRPVIADTSTGMALSTAATGIEGAVSFVDTAIKKGIQNATYAAVDPIRDQFTAGLEQVKASLDAGVIPAPVQAVAGTTSGRSLLDANNSADEEPDLPAGLESGLGRISQLAAAKAAGSPRLNDTQYAKDTLSVAKQLRNQYGSGYRDYIDQEVSKASGLPVANSYAQNMLQDINRQLTQMGKTKDDIGTLMMKNLDVPGNPDAGVPNMGAYITMRNNKDPKYPGDAFILGKISDWQHLQTQIKVDADIRARSADDTVTKQKTATASLTKNYNDTVDMYLNDVRNLSGMPGLGSMVQYFQDLQAGRHPEATGAEVLQRVQQLQAYRQGVDMQLKKQGQDAELIIGSDVAEGLRKKALAPLDALITLSNDKNSSPAFFHLHQNEAIKADDENGWLVSKDKGALSRQMITGRTVFGEQYFPTWIGNIISQKGPDGKPLDQPIQDVFSQEAMSAVIPLTDKRGEPLPPRYIKDAIQHGKKVEIPADSGYFGKVTGLIGTIADPNMPLPVKDKLIDWAFNPKNVGVLDELKMDYKDPRTGEWVPGKYRAFNLLSAPTVTNSIAETAKVHPQNYTNYQSLLEQEFGKIYRSDVITLNKVVDTRMVPVDASGRPVTGPVSTDQQVTNKKVQDMHFSFNEGNNSFGIVDKNNRPITRANLSVRDPNYSAKSGTLDVLERVNGGLANLAYVQKSNPAGAGDTPKYILQTLQQVGFRPGENIDGATKEMMKAVIKSRAPDMTPEELNQRVLQFAPEDDRSLAAFLRSPAGQRQGQNLDPQQTRNVIRGNISDQPLGAPIRLNR